MLKITLVALASYAVVLAFIDPTAGGEHVHIHNERNMQGGTEEGQIMVTERVFNSKILTPHGHHCHCDFNNCCDAKECCKAHEKCCWNTINPRTFYCCEP